MSHTNTGIRIINPGNPGTGSGAGSAPATIADLDALRGELLARLIHAEDPLRFRKILNADITNLSADKITSGTITVDLEIGDGTITLDGTANQIRVTDGTPTDRVIIGDLGADYGINIYNAAGTLMWSMTDGAQTVGIADLSVTNAKVNDLTVDKLTTGTLTATVTLSGTIKTAASGQRVEMDDDGLRAYDSGGTALVDIKTAGSPVFELRTAASGDRLSFDPDGLNMILGSTGRDAWTLDTEGLGFYPQSGGSGSDTWEGIDYWRDNQGDSIPFARIVSEWSGTTTRKLRLLTQATNGNDDATFELNANPTAQMSTYDAGNQKAFVNVDVGQHAASKGRVRIDSDAGDSAAGRMTLWEDEQTDGQVIQLSGLTRVIGAGMQYPNGFIAEDTAITSGSTDTTSVTYANSFSSASEIPAIIGSLNGQNSSEQFWRANSVSRSGCDILHTNLAAGDRAQRVLAIPIAIA